MKRAPGSEQENILYLFVSMLYRNMFIVTYLDDFV